jgi:lipoprotein-anchoring transpeptidase ErfK/SrfK
MKKKRKKQKNRMLLLLTAVFVFGGLLAAYGILSLAKSGKEDQMAQAAAARSAAEGEAENLPETVKQTVDPADYQLTLQFRNGDSQTVKGIFREPPSATADSSDGNVRTVVLPEGNLVYRTSDLKQLLDSFPELQESGWTQPENARIEKQDSGFVIIPETPGTALNRDALVSAVEQALSGGREMLDLEQAQDVYAQPAVKQDNADLQAQLAQLNQITGASITYRLPGEEVTLDGSTTSGWLTQNADGTWIRDDAVWNQHVSDFVSQLAAEHDTINRDRTFPATGIGNITVKGTGYYGYEIDEPAETAQLTQELDSGTVTTREPCRVQTEYAARDDNSGIGQNYVEVDLSRQHLWVYRDGAVAFETDVVSGTMNESYYTPEGVYKILDKKQNATLLGDAIPGKKDYYTYTQPVSYWMPFTYTGIGLHDASWRGAFGGTIYVSDGSHGCVNLPAAAAAQIFNLVEIQEPVVCYYSQPYSLASAPEGQQTEGVYYNSADSGAVQAG